MSHIQIVIAILTASLISLGLGALLRRPRTGGTTPPQKRPEPGPDTTIQTIDDELAVETAGHIDTIAAEHDADPAVVQDLVADANKHRSK